ncbi:MAG: Holliday junction branch migration protein RuvA [Candidatus Nanopelagicaceae bacterium]
MIAQIAGSVLEVRLTSIVVNVSGIGYEINVAPDLASKIAVGDEIALYTSLVVREDSWKLFGYKSADARDLFNELQSVTGIGPKVAHSLLNVFDAEKLQSIIGSGDQLALEQVPGIGKKVASRLILELRERYNTGKSKNTASGKWRDSLTDALISLGYSAKDAERRIEETISELDVDPASVELSELLKRSLAGARSAK